MGNQRLISTSCSHPNIFVYIKAGVKLVPPSEKFTIYEKNRHKHISKKNPEPLVRSNIHIKPGSKTALLSSRNRKLIVFYFLQYLIKFCCEHLRVHCFSYLLPKGKNILNNKIKKCEIISQLDCITSHMNIIIFFFKCEIIP